MILPRFASHSSHFDTWNCRPCNHGIVRPAWKRTNTPNNLLLVITRKSTWSSKWPWRSNWAIFPIHILIEFHIAIIISYIFGLTSRSNGQWWKPMEIRSLLNKSKGVSACRPSIEAWPTLLVTCGFDSKWSQWLSLIHFKFNGVSA